MNASARLREVNPFSSFIPDQSIYNYTNKIDGKRHIKNGERSMKVKRIKDNRKSCIKSKIVMTIIIVIIIINNNNINISYNNN